MKTFSGSSHRTSRRRSKRISERCNSLSERLNRATGRRLRGSRFADIPVSHRGRIMKGLDPHDPRPMLVIFAGILLIAAWRVLSSVTSRGPSHSLSRSRPSLSVPSLSPPRWLHNASSPRAARFATEALWRSCRPTSSTRSPRRCCASPPSGAGRSQGARLARSPRLRAAGAADQRRRGPARLPAEAPAALAQASAQRLPATRESSCAMRRGGARQATRRPSEVTLAPS